MKYIYELHKTMLARNLILVYEGEFTQEITKSILAMVERNMDSMGEEASVKRKVFNVMVESLQNIVKHCDQVLHPEQEKKHMAIFMISKMKEEYVITSGNAVTKESEEKLKDRLDSINALDKDGLKKLYKDIIKTTEISDKGGAGLGFVDMARKSGKKLDYDFSEINDTHSFFSLQASIERI